MTNEILMRVVLFFRTQSINQWIKSIQNEPKTPLPSAIIDIGSCRTSTANRDFCQFMWPAALIWF